MKELVVGWWFFCFRVLRALERLIHCKKRACLDPAQVVGAGHQGTCQLRRVLGGDKCARQPRKEWNGIMEKGLRVLGRGEHQGTS